MSVAGSLARVQRRAREREAELKIGMAVHTCVRAQQSADGAFRRGWTCGQL